MLSEKDEQRKLKNVLKRIEQRKKAKEKQRQKADLVNAVKAVKAKKRDRKANLIPIPNAENDEFIDKNIAPPQEGQISKQKHITDVSKLEGFTVLGTENFNKKAEVC